MNLGPPDYESDFYTVANVRVQIFEGESFHLQDQAFEVFALGVVDADGMVGWLGELVQDAHAAARLGCGAEHGQAELLFVHCL